MKEKEHPELTTLYIPKHLLETFSNFIELGISSIEVSAERVSWTDEERELVEWLERGKYLK